MAAILLSTSSFSFFNGLFPLLKGVSAMPKLNRVLLFLLVAIAGCGNPTIIFDTLTPSGTQSLDSGQSVTVTASVMNDPSNTGVTWTLNGTGTLTSVTTTSVV